MIEYGTGVLHQNVHKSKIYSLTNDKEMTVNTIYNQSKQRPLGALNKENHQFFTKISDFQKATSDCRICNFKLHF